MNMTQPPKTYRCTRPEEEHSFREYVPGVWYPMPPMKFSSRTEQDDREMRCLVTTGHGIHPLMQDGVGLVDKAYFCCECGMTVNLQKKSWWQLFLWELRGRR